MRRYRDDALNQVAFPLGGIGTGTLWLRGWGPFGCAELWGRPDKANPLRRSGFQLVTDVGTVALEGPPPPAVALAAAGTGRDTQRLGLGRRRFGRAEFAGSFPTATLRLSDAAVPVRAQVEAWSPFVPGRADDSSVPAALFEWVMSNHGDQPLEVVLRLELEANATRGEPMEFGWEVSWSTPGGRDSHRERGLVKLVPCTGPHAPVSEIHAAVVVEKWVAGLVRRVTSLNRHEGYQEIQDLQRRELPALEAYAQPHPSLAHAVSRVRHLFTQALRPIAERSRKEMYLLSKKLQLREADHRKVHRGAWFDQMPGTESHT